MIVIGYVITGLVVLFMLFLLVSLFRKTSLETPMLDNSLLGNPEDRARSLLHMANAAISQKTRIWALNEYYKLHDQTSLRFTRLSQDMQDDLLAAENQRHAPRGTPCIDIYGRRYIEPGYDAIVTTAKQLGISRLEAERQLIDEQFSNE